MSKTQILLMILVFVVLTFGSFIWMIVTWDKGTETSITLGFPSEISREARV
ncbi:hypothetical protein [Yoonia sp. MH D7]